MSSVPCPECCGGTLKEVVSLEALMSGRLGWRKCYSCGFQQEIDRKVPSDHARDVANLVSEACEHSVEIRQRLRSALGLPLDF